MGNKNDYLTLEDAARMLGRPLVVLKRAISDNRITQTYTRGHWSIRVRDLEGLRQGLPPEPERAVHNSLPDGTPKKPSKALGPPKKAENALEPARVTELLRKAKPSQKATSSRKVKPKKQKKSASVKRTKAKESGGKRASASSGLGAAERLYGRIRELDRRIKSEAGRCREAEQNGLYRDVGVLKDLVSLHAALCREYARVPDPLGLLPPLVLAARKKPVGNANGYYNENISKKRYWFNEE